jgi:hypothetical protein
MKTFSQFITESRKSHVRIAVNVRGKNHDVRLHQSDLDSFSGTVNKKKFNVSSESQSWEKEQGHDAPEYTSLKGIKMSVANQNAHLSDDEHHAVAKAIHGLSKNESVNPIAWDKVETDHRETLRAAGWRSAGGSKTKFQHPDLPGHRITLGVASWEHANKKGTVEMGKTAKHLWDHLSNPSVQARLYTFGKK